jgi:hypothetical protein
MEAMQAETVIMGDDERVWRSLHSEELIAELIVS